MIPVTPKEERRVKRLLRRLIGLAQGVRPHTGADGKPRGGRLAAFCRATGRSYSATVNKLNLGHGKHGRGLCLPDAGFVVDVCRYCRTLLPVQLLARLAEGRRVKRKLRIEVAA